MEKNRRVSFIRYGTGEARLVWRVLIAVVAYVAIAFLLRFVPIFLSVAIRTGQGVDRQDALEVAKALAFHHPVWSTVICIINGFMSVALVWFLMRLIEKRRMVWRDIGLDWRRSSFLALALGSLLAVLMYAGGALIAQMFGPFALTIHSVLASLSAPAVLRNLAQYIPMGFGEEVLFRGYIQTRLVERHGSPWGILIGSIVFTLLHLFGRPLSPVAIVSGVILWAAVGALYHWSRSLYLVGMFHGAMNTLLNVLPSHESDVTRLLVHILTLLLIVAIGRRWSSCFYALSGRATGGQTQA